jgi:hypothetical protein
MPGKLTAAGKKSINSFYSWLLLTFAITIYFLRSPSKSFRIRLYSSAQLVSSVKL